MPSLNKYLLLALATIAWGQTTHQEIPLFPHGAPNAQGTAPEDIPTLTLYPVKGEGVTATAVLVCRAAVTRTYR